MAYYNKNDWDDPTLEDWSDEDSETEQVRVDERQCFPFGFVGGVGIGIGLGGFGCFPRRFCFPREFGCFPRGFCFPREFGCFPRGFCFPREGFCFPRQGCRPRPCFPI